MRWDVVLPNEAADLEPSTLGDLAVEAERLGYATAWLPDHLLPPDPYGPVFGGVHEPLVTVAYLAARTSVLRLGTSVLIVPLREPFLLAKQVATLARLSGDRITLGVGVGWERGEFTVAGQDFRTRGRRTDEILALLRHLHAGPDPDDGFTGRFHGYERGVFAPVPHHPVPVMVGGMSDAALARAARLGDEWQGVGLDPDAFAARLADLRALTDRPVVAGTRIEAETDADVDAAAGLATELAARGAQAIAVWFGAADGFADRMAAFRAAVR